MVGTASATMDRSLIRSPEALAMGGAYTAIVEDRDAAFYNPAGVAAYDHISLHLVDLDPTVSNWVVSGWKTLQNLKNPSGATLNQLMGQNIYVQGTATTAILAPGFALIGLYDQQGALYAKNQALPKIEYGYQTTEGVQAAFGYSIKDGQRRGRGRHDRTDLDEWRFGIGLKYLTRTGGYRDLSAAQLFSINSTNASSLIGGKGSGYGGDLGVQRVQHINPRLLGYWGAAFLNVGDVAFGNGAASQRGDLSTGIGLKYKLAPATSLTFAYDIQQMNESDDFSKKQNVGLRLGIPLVDVSMGFHQGFFTYGAAVDVWLLRISATIYREELGPYQQEDPESRFALRVDFKIEM
jgi:hypothetical protein